MSILVIVLIAVVVLVAVVLLLAASKPAVFRIHREIKIAAPPERIYPMISDFHNWTAWSPYEQYDPAMKKTYSGARSGLGAVYQWAGNNKAGTGRMEITDTSFPSKITIKLDFLKPFEGHNVGEFALETQAGGTNVRWSMQGPNSFMSKTMSVFVNMDTLIGKDFETGLANLKRATEAESLAQSATFS
jgi:hypothetical protein